jgi:hypothetical protein
MMRSAKEPWKEEWVGKWLRRPGGLQANVSEVAQTFSLLYRRFSICRRFGLAPSQELFRRHSGPTPGRLEVGDTADWKSALLFCARLLATRESL